MLIVMENIWNYRTIRVRQSHSYNKNNTTKSTVFESGICVVGDENDVAPKSRYVMCI